MTPLPGPDRALGLIARGQHGAFSREQALAAGLTSAAIDHRCATGRWRRVGRGVYAEAATPDGWHLDAAATLLVLGGEAALARSSAARLFELRVPSDARLHAVVHSRCPQSFDARVVVHRTQTLQPHHVTVRDGLRTTTAARTLVDLASTLHPIRLRSAITDAVRREVTTARAMWTIVHEVGRLRGVRAVKDVLTELSSMEAATASELESRWLRLVTRAGLEPTAMNHPVTDASGRTRYLDAVYLPQGVAVELDGRAFHSLETDRNDDRLRANELALAGFSVVLRFTWWDVTERPAYVLETIRRALAAHTPVE